MRDPNYEEIDEQIATAYLNGYFEGQKAEQRNSKKYNKQRAFFASICIIADKAKEVTTLAGGKYKRVVLNFPKEVLEELEEWSKGNERS